jgi:hypothetical protein
MATQTELRSRSLQQQVQARAQALQQQRRREEAQRIAQQQAAQQAQQARNEQIKVGNQTFPRWVVEKAMRNIEHKAAGRRAPEINKLVQAAQRALIRSSPELERAMSRGAEASQRAQQLGFSSAGELTAFQGFGGRGKLASIPEKQVAQGETALETSEPWQKLREAGVIQDTGASIFSTTRIPPQTQITTPPSVLMPEQTTYEKIKGTIRGFLTVKGAEIEAEYREVAQVPETRKETTIADIPSDIVGISRSTYEEFESAKQVFRVRDPFGKFSTTLVPEQEVKLPSLWGGTDIRQQPPTSQQIIIDYGGTYTKSPEIHLEKSTQISEIPSLSIQPIWSTQRTVKREPLKITESALEETTIMGGEIGLALTPITGIPMGTGAISTGIKSIKAGEVGMGTGQVVQGAFYLAPTIGKGVSSLWKSVPRKSLGGLSIKQAETLAATKRGTAQWYSLRMKALRTIEKKGDPLWTKAFTKAFPQAKPAGYLQTEVSLLKLGVERARVAGGESQSPFITFGEKGFTKREVSKLAEDLVRFKAYKTKEQAYKAITSVRQRKDILDVGFSKSLDVPKGQPALLESGLMEIKLQRVTPPKLEYSPFLEQQRFESYTITGSRKTTKGLTEAQFSYGLGKKGQIVDLTLGIRRTPKGSKISMINFYKSGKSSTRIFKGKGGVVLKQEFFDQYIREPRTVFGKPEGFIVIKGEKGYTYRQYNPIFKQLKSKGRRLGSGELLLEFDDTTMPTPEKLQKMYALGGTKERQFIKEIVGKKGKEAQFLQGGLKKQTFPTDDVTLFLAQEKKLSDKFVIRGIGLGRGEVPVKVPEIKYYQLGAKKPPSAFSDMLASVSGTTPTSPKITLDKTITSLGKTGKTQLVTTKPKVVPTQLFDESISLVPTKVPSMRGIRTPKLKPAVETKEVPLLLLPPRISQSTILEDKQILLPTTDEKVLQDVGTNLGIDTSGRSVQMPKELQLIRQVQEQETVQETIQEQVQLLRVPSETPRKPITPSVEPPFSPSEKKVVDFEMKPKKEKLFETFVRKAKEDVSIGEFTTLREAKIKLAQRLKRTLRASGFIERRGKKLKVTQLGKLGREFRPSKVEPFRVVQKRGKRLSSLPEVKEIQFFKKKKGKKKSRRFKFL